jgi:Tfp pilus assembly protein PilN
VKAVNLIPTEQRRVRATGNRSGSSYVLIGVLATLLVMVATYVFTAGNVTDRQNKAAAAKAEADQLEAQAAKSKSFTNFAQIKQTRLASVSTIASSRFDWERMMRELSLVLPERTWITEADASLTGAQDSESGGDEDAPAGPSAKLVGCARRQPDVAKLMVRLRQMHQVEDVTLKESSLGGDDGGSSAGSGSTQECGRYYQFELTAALALTEPAADGSRDSGPVPASLGGGQ